MRRPALGYYVASFLVSLILATVTILAVDLMWMQYVTQWWIWGYRSAVSVVAILISVVLLLLADEDGLYVISPWLIMSVLGVLAQVLRYAFE